MNRPASPSVPWPISLAAVAAAAAALAYLWYGWCVFPLSNWNEVRLAPAFALRHGLPVYAPAGGGPLSTWIYGPVPLLLNLPATFAPTAVTAIQVAGVINALTLIAPFALVVWTLDDLRRKPWPIRACALALSVLLLPAGSLVFQVADHTAIACGMISCWCLGRRATPEFQPTAAAAGWCVLAICAKQTSVFLVVAQVIYLGVFVSRGAVLRYLGWAGALGALAALACGAAFGFGSLWFNLVEIPARIPWGNPAEKIALRWPHLAAYLLLPGVLLALWRRSRFWPERGSTTGRSVRCAAVAFAALLPAGLMSFLKIGGDTNVFHSWPYLLPLLVAALVVPASATPRNGYWLLAGTAAVIALRLPEFHGLPSRPLTAHLTQATQLAATAPHTTWFPNNPVITFYRDGRLYHVEDGLATRHLAGLGVREVDFRRHLPPELATIVYGSDFTAPFALQLLSDFKLEARSAHWSIYRRPASVKP